jgi:hypothetical protein
MPFCPQPAPNENLENTSAIPAPIDVNEPAVRELTEGAEPQLDTGETRAGTSVPSDDQDTDDKSVSTPLAHDLERSLMALP